MLMRFVFISVLRLSLIFNPSQPWKIVIFCSKLAAICGPPETENGPWDVRLRHQGLLISLPSLMAQNLMVAVKAAERLGPIAGMEQWAMRFFVRNAF